MRIWGILFFLPMFAFTQKVENVQSIQQDKKIVVTYDLSGLNNRQMATVSLFCSEDGGSTWSSELKKVSGDVGAGIMEGVNKKIIWDVLAEQEKFVGDQMVFELQAKIPSSTLSFEPEMVFIKGGTFLMGSNDEKPGHTVTVSGFYMGKYEVTQAQWKEIMYSNPSNFNGDNLPVENVSWIDVQNYLNELNRRTGKKYRLPTEAEWEYACRAGTATPFNTGDCLGTDQANYDGNYPYTGCIKGVYRAKTMPVGSFAPNAWGLYDMHGNAWEWCSDWYDADYYSKSPLVDPQGPTSGIHRVNRGGSWSGNAGYCRSARRYDNLPDYRYYLIGFRLVCPSLK